jgi:general secretion pathway protein G
MNTPYLRTPNRAITRGTRLSQGGFTLLEIMMVVIIIALLAGAAIHFMGGNVGIAQETRVKTDVQAISTQLKVYQALNGFLPSSEQGLKALVSQPTSDPRPRQWRQFFDKLPLDPWQNEYNYMSPGKRNPNSFDLFSSGNDRKAGTPDDVGNWE